MPASFFYDPSSPELAPKLEDRELPRTGTKASRFMGRSASSTRALRRPRLRLQPGEQRSLDLERGPFESTYI